MQQCWYGAEPNEVMAQEVALGEGDWVNVEVDGTAICSLIVTYRNVEFTRVSVFLVQMFSYLKKRKKGHLSFVQITYPAREENIIFKKKSIANKPFVSHNRILVLKICRKTYKM